MRLIEDAWINAEKVLDSFLPRNIKFIAGVLPDNVLQW